MVSPLCTDLYQISMLGAHFPSGGYNKRAVFEFFVRHPPHGRRFMVLAGLQKALAVLQDLAFTTEDIEYLRTIPGLGPIMTGAFIRYLLKLRFSGDVYSMKEGEVFFPGEPVLRVEAAMGEAQLVETVLLSILNTATAVASKAARIRLAAPGKTLLEFGTRRTSPEEAVETARAAYIAGFDATSNLEAGRSYGIPVAGTMAHSWVMAHKTEQEAFRRWSSIYPHSSVIVDTYNTLCGVEEAIRTVGAGLSSIRLDSGDLSDLSRQARAKLDAAGLTNTSIIASGDLDENRIEALLAEGAPIDGFGVGTCLSRCIDAPALGGVYKLTSIAGRPVCKTQPGKDTLPGAHQVWRHDRWMCDTVGLDGWDATPASSYPLLGLAMKYGRPVYKDQTAAQIRQFCQARIQNLPEHIWTGPHPILRTKNLKKLQIRSYYR